MTDQVLVTGADGFVGRIVCRRLQDAGYTPRGLWDGELWPALQAATPGLSQFAVLGDLGANPDLRASVDAVSVVVHMAARVHVMHDSAIDPLHEFRRVNVGGTVAVSYTHLTRRRRG